MTKLNTLIYKKDVIVLNTLLQNIPSHLSDINKLQDGIGNVLSSIRKSIDTTKAKCVECFSNIVYDSLKTRKEIQGKLYVDSSAGLDSKHALNNFNNLYLDYFLFNSDQLRK